MMMNCKRKATAFLIKNNETMRKKGVRLIAVNDGVDSFSGEDDFTPFRNIMNEWYARDISKKNFKDKKSHYVSQDQWLIFENTHEAIIDQETFDNVQRIRGQIRRYPDGWGEAHPLTSLMYCADCGGKMYVHRVNNGKRIPQYTCADFGKVLVGTLCKTRHRINAGHVMELVADMIRQSLSMQI